MNFLKITPYSSADEINNMKYVIENNYLREAEIICSEQNGDSLIPFETISKIFDSLKANNSVSSISLVRYDIYCISNNGEVAHKVPEELQKDLQDLLKKPNLSSFQLTGSMGKIYESNIDLHLRILPNPIESAISSLALNYHVFPQNSFYDSNKTLFSGLTCLDLSNNENHKSAIRIFHVVKNLISMTSLKSLNLIGSPLSPESATNIANFLINSSRIKDLRFTLNTDLTAEAIHNLTVAFIQNESLQSVVFEEDTVVDRLCFARAIPQVIYQNKSLKELVLSQQSTLVANFPAGRLNALSKALKRNHSLTSFELNQYKINTLGCEALASVLKENTTLVHLGISDHLLTAAAVASFCSVNNNTLLSLRLTGGVVGNLNGRGSDIVKLLASYPSLTSLSLEMCGLNAQDLAAIERAIENNSTITNLMLYERNYNKPRMEHYKGVEPYLLRNLHNIEMKEGDLQGICWKVVVANSVDLSGFPESSIEYFVNKTQVQPTVAQLKQIHF